MTRAAVVVAAVVAAALPARAAAADTIAIVGATVYETPDKKLDRATVLIRDGKIVAVGADVAVPAGATRIDGADKIVTAGLIEASTSLGLIAIDAEPAANDGRLGPAPGDDDRVHAAYRVIDAYDPDAIAIPIARAGGVTAAVAAPGGGLIAGQSAWFALADGVTAAVRAPAAMHAALGNDAGDASGGSRGRAVERLREVLDDAAAYARTKAAYDRNQSRALAAGRLDLDALLPVLRGRVPLVVEAHAAQDIRAALRLAADFRLKLVITGGTEAWKVAAELAEADVPVILDPTANLPRLEAPDVRDDAAAVLARAGVAVAISTLGDGSQARNLRQLAGNAVADGLTWEQGLAAITTVPAAIYGLADRGRIARGAAADLVVWSGDPLELTSRAELVIVGGAVQATDTHQTRLRDRYR